MIPSLDALKAIDEFRQGALVVATMTGLEEWQTISGDPARDVPLEDVMGKASSFGLGLALAQPSHKVAVIDGDGSLLSNLGSLVTIANSAPANLIHFVLQDDMYFSTGAASIPGADILSFAGLASSAGYPVTYEFDDLEEFVTQLETIFQQEGPIFVCLKIQRNGVPKSPPRSFHEAREQLRVLFNIM
jgi:phosphonopyruvate decarboxylase